MCAENLILVYVESVVLRQASRSTSVEGYQGMVIFALDKFLEDFPKFYNCFTEAIDRSECPII